MSETEEGGSGDGSGKVIQLRPRVISEGGEAAVPDQVVPFYPPRLKGYYLDVLAKYKDEQSRTRGKVVGWLTIRDEMMASEDAKLREKMRREGLEVEVDRPRSAALTLDDIKGWYKVGRSHLPSDRKFQYIDRFVRGLRLKGQLDVIELAAAEAQREYFREALSQYYRPDWSFITVDDKGEDCPSNEVAGLLSGAAFGSVCIFDGERSDGFLSALRAPGRERFVLLMLCGPYRQDLAGVDMIACHLPDWAWGRLKKGSSGPGALRDRVGDVLSGLDVDDILLQHLYSGFIVPEEANVGSMTLFSVQASLYLRKLTLSTRWGEGFVFQIRRYYDPQIDLVWSGVGGIGWENMEHDQFIRLGLGAITTPGQGSMKRQGFEKLVETRLLRKVREKFAVGYRPC